MDNNVERILARVRKMLALADNAGATEGERDNALRMAHATLAKHNLDMAAVEQSGKPQVEPRTITKRQFYGRPWARTIASSIADMCFCFYLVTSAKQATRVTHWFIGRESNSVSASELAEWVVKSIWSEGHRLARATGQGNEYARTFATGAAYAIRARCQQLKTAPEQTQPGTALVLASFYDREKQDNLDWLAAAGIGFRTTQSRAKHLASRAAYESGASYGNSISLNRGISGTQQKRLS